MMWQTNTNVCTLTRRCHCDSNLSRALPPEKTPEMPRVSAAETGEGQSQTGNHRRIIFNIYQKDEGLPYFVSRGVSWVTKNLNNLVFFLRRKWTSSFLSRSFHKWIKFIVQNINQNNSFLASTDVRNLRTVLGLNVALKQRHLEKPNGGILLKRHC